MSISQISWKGPRPLAPGDVLRGRDDELGNLVNKARNFHVLEITAPSGVGKSSFIAAGLVPQLEESGAHILPAGQDWSWSTVLTRYDKQARATDDPELLYRLCLGWPTAEDDDSIGDRFAALRVDNSKPIVVLDQFEELIRYRERLGAQLLDFIGKTASRHKVTHVVAARSEYRDRFRPMEVASGGTFFHWPLAEIDSKDSVDIIISDPVRRAGLEIDPTATKHLRAWWLAAREQPASDLVESVVGRADVGLLHLQGVLWLFKKWLQAHVPDDTSTITLDHLRTFANDYVGGSDDRTAPQLYHRALVEYVRECCDALHSADTDVDRWMQPRTDDHIPWTNGPRLMMAKSAHLFSVLGYKVAQSRSGMFQTVLAEDMEPPTARAVTASAATSRAADWLAETADKHGREVQGRGIAIEWSGSDVLAELLAAATQAWAASALTGANILRRFVQSDEDVYELVHDGMGHALQEWAREELLKPRSILGVITQRAGKSLHLPLEPKTFLTSGSDQADQGSRSLPAYWDGFASIEDSGTITVNGLGWDASLITSNLTDVVIDGWTLTGALFKNFNTRSTINNVVFRECDFRGAAIRDVTMTNVLFERCNLHGASFSDCTLDGVEFVHANADGSVEESSSIDLFSFVRCEASGQGASLRSLRDVKGLVFDKVKGGPWLLQGTDVRHVAMNGDSVHGVEFKVGPGSYGHITVEPVGLAIEVDAAAEITASEITVAGRPGS